MKKGRKGEGGKGRRGDAHASVSPFLPFSPSPFPPSPRRGFTLVELMVVVAVIAIMLSLTIPHYENAMEQSQANIAAANLRAIWSAERFYWLENSTYAANLGALQSLGLVDPQVVTGTSGYSYQVSEADANTFTATATRTGSPSWSGTFQVDQTGQISGTIQAAGYAAIGPGFQ